MASEGTVPRRWIRLLLLLATAVAGFLGQYWLSWKYFPQQAAWAWLTAAVGFVLLFFLSDESRELPSPGAVELSPAQEQIGFATVLVIGLFFVVYNIGEFPPGINHDAAWEAMYGIRILNGEPYIAYANEAWGRETFTFYFKAIGQYFLGPTQLAIEAPSMVAGYLTLPFFYWWARNSFGAGLALIATTLLASSGWHLIFSRTGWRSDFQPFFTVLTCCFFVRGMRRAKALDFALAGIFLAATLNTYNASRVLPGLFLVWLPLVVLQSWKLRGFLRRYGWPMLAGVVAFAFAIAPLAWFAVNHWSIFNSRAVALRGQAEMWQAVRQSFLLFNLAGNGDDFFVREPGLELAASVLFVFGLLWCLLKIRDERAQFLLLGFLLGLVPGWISRPNMNRCIGTMPFVFLMSGLGLEFFRQQLRRLLPGAGVWLGLALAVLACGTAVVDSYQQFLGPNRRPVWGYYPETARIGRLVKSLVPDYAVWVGGANWPRDTITYLSYQGVGHPERRNYSWVENISLVARANVAPPEGKGAAFIVPLTDRGPSALSALLQRFPNHKLEDVRYPENDNGVLIAKLLRVEEADVRAVPREPSWPTLPVNSQTDVQSLGRAPGASAPDQMPTATEPLGLLHQPRGISIDSKGNIFVADFGNHRIQKFSPELRPQAHWGTQGDQPGFFKEPCDVAVGPDGSIHVADTWNQRIQVFNEDGKFLRQFGGGMFGPRGVAVAGDGTVYVTDTGNNRVLRYSPQGARQADWGSKGGTVGTFLEPVGIAVDTKGKVYVCDNGNGRVQVFASDGKPLKQFAVEGWQGGAWSEPHLTVAPDGTIWLTVPLAKEVRAYTADGKLKRTITAEQGKFRTPMGIAFDAQRRELIIAELENKLVRISVAE